MLLPEVESGGKDPCRTHQREKVPLCWPADRGPSEEIEKADQVSGVNVAEVNPGDIDPPPPIR